MKDLVQDQEEIKEQLFNHYWKSIAKYANIKFPVWYKQYIGGTFQV